MELEGQYCVLRAYYSGVVAGKITGLVTLGATSYFRMQDARRMQEQQYLGFTLMSVATLGIGTESRLSEPVPVHYVRVDDVAEIMPVTAAAEKTIREQKNG